MAEEQTATVKSVDRFGAVASTACAIHCAICALAPTAFAAFGLGFLLGHEVEWGLTLVAVGFGLLALYFGWRLHKKPLVAVLLGVGIVGLVAVRLMEGGGHHDEHGETHAEAEEGDHEAEEGDHEAEEEGDHEGEDGDHEGEDGDHEGEEGHDDHGPGEGLGVLAGLILMAGHVMNLKAMKEPKKTSEDDCC